MTHSREVTSAQTAEDKLESKQTQAINGLTFFGLTFLARIYEKVIYELFVLVHMISEQSFSFRHNVDEQILVIHKDTFQCSVYEARAT